MIARPQLARDDGGMTDDVRAIDHEEVDAAERVTEIVLGEHPVFAVPRLVEQLAERFDLIGTELVARDLPQVRHGPDDIDRLSQVRGGGLYSALS